MKLGHRLRTLEARYQHACSRAIKIAKVLLRSWFLCEGILIMLSANALCVVLMIKCYLFPSYTAVNSVGLKRVSTDEADDFLRIFHCLQSRDLLKLRTNIKLPFPTSNFIPMEHAFTHTQDKLNRTCWSSASRHHIKFQNCRKHRCTHLETWRGKSISNAIQFSFAPRAYKSF